MKAAPSLILLIGVSFFLTACTIVEKENPSGPSITPNKNENKISTGITTIDSEWNRYTNGTFGWAIKFPKNHAISEGGCFFNKVQGSYRPKPATVPTKVFGGEGRVSFKPEYIYKLTGEESRDGVSYFSGCEKTETTQNSNMGWTIVSTKADSEKSLQDFIKGEYGQGCTLEVKKPTSTDNVYDVIIGHLTDGDAEDCFINYMYTIKYNQETKVAVSWKLGQAFSYFKSDDFDKGAYDEEMLNSFEFITQNP